MAFDVPILFLVFNRPSTTARVFEQFRALKPRRLYVAADGPRANVETDAANCAAVREICSNIDWECDVKTLYRSTNLGCKVAVSSAIDWFFDQVEEGIIIEDDILVDPSFFTFCERLLVQYRNEPTVMQISAFNIAGRWKEGVQSWHFSYLGPIWGWASWRRAWRLYDVTMSQWRDPSVQARILNQYFPKAIHKKRKELYDQLSEGLIDTWDYQWTFCKLLHGGLSAVPAVNLVNNIGFSSEATHSSSAPWWVVSHVDRLDLTRGYSGALKNDRKFDTLYVNRTNGYSPPLRRLLGRIKAVLTLK